MKIVSIFAHKLFAFQFEDENEYDRNIELWTDSSYLYKFAKKYLKGIDYSKYVNERLEDAEQIIDLIEEISLSKTENLESFFRPISDTEYVMVPLSLQKGKTTHKFRRNDLRFYAIRIDENCFVITGGAIKVSQKMSENELTQTELDKLKACKQFLESNNVFDGESFIDFKNEEG
jgi:hypothetical protein